jgi:hypothetical protein
MALLTGEQIKAETAKRRRFDEVEVEELGGSVRLLALTAGDLIHLQSLRSESRATSFEYVARSWVSESNDPLFPIEEGVAVAKSLSDEVYARILKAVLRLNGVAEDAIEQAEKN